MARGRRRVTGKRRVKSGAKERGRETRDETVRYNRGMTGKYEKDEGKQIHGGKDGGGQEIRGKTSSWNEGM